MTAGQISKLHNLCLQINLLAAKRDDGHAPHGACELKSSNRCRRAVI